MAKNVVKDLVKLLDAAVQSGEIHEATVWSYRPVSKMYDNTDDKNSVTMSGRWTTTISIDHKSTPPKDETIMSKKPTVLSPTCVFENRAKFLNDEVEFECIKINNALVQNPMHDGCIRYGPDSRISHEALEALVRLYRDAGWNVTVEDTDQRDPLVLAFRRA